MNAIYLFATTSPNFQGQLTVDSLTGTVKAINAKPAGTYAVRLKAINGFSNTTITFNLIVANPVCGNPAGGNNVSINQLLGPLCIADFNGDGKQDFATPAVFGTNIHLQFGNDSAGFTGGYYFAPAAGNTVYALATGDVNGDGRPDLLSTGYYNNVVHVLLNNGPGTFRLVATVPVGEYPDGIVVTDVNNDSRPDFITCNYNSKTASVRLGDGLGNFTGNTEIPLGMVPSSIYAADFNGDGNTDFITANSGSANLSVRLGNGSGGFTAAPNVTIPSDAYQLAIADFNGDGKMDIASANNNTGNVSIRLGSGTGTFTGTTNLPIGAAAPCVVAGDFNGDGKTDLAAGDKTSKVYLRYGDGAGNFAGYTTLNIGYETRYLAVSDFNNDGRQDLAVNYRTDVFTESVAIRPGGKSDISLQGNGANIVNGSTTPDAANYTDFGTGDSITRTFSIRNTGTANLAIGSLVINGGDSALFSIGDINLPAIVSPGSTTIFTISFSPVSAGQKTGIIRLVSDNCDNGSYTFTIKGTGISPVLGNYPATTVNRAGGNVVITPSVAPSQHQYVVATASPNFKGIFGVDSATRNLSITNAGPEGNYTATVTAYNYGVKTSTTFSLRINSPACSQALFAAADISQPSFYPYRVAIADFNGDGKQDFALASAAASNVIVRLGDGAGGVGATSTIPVGTVPFALAVGDFNGDSKQDFLASSATDSYVRIRLGDGAGGFAAGADVAMPGTPQSIAVADFNGDGRLDFVTENASNNSGIPLRLGDGRGGFADGGFITQVLYASFVHTADLNNDGKADLLVKNNTSGSISILFGNGTGGFSLAGTASAGANYKNLTTADFNNDGFQDIAALIESNNSVTILLGNGAGVFTAVSSIATGALPQAMFAGDFNGDGNPDVAITNYNSSFVTIATGNGLGGFGIYTVAVAANPQGIAGGDFNNDGLIDLAIATSGSTTLAVRLGAQNDINVKGNNISIPLGSITPSVANYTDFGNVSSTLARTFIIQNTGKAALTVNAVNIMGTDSAQFSRSGIAIPATIAAGDSLRFSLNFVPTTTGQKNATVSILSNDCDEAVHTFAIRGTGIVLSPQLGNYPATTIASAGGNTVVSPVAAPVNATNITASAGPDFKGLLRVDATTGAVYITNAQPAGTYTVMVKVNGLASASASFTLTVGAPACSQGLFTGSNYYNAGYSTYSIAVTDLNNDGKQDLVYPSYGLNVRLGDGAGNYNTVTTYGPNANYNGLAADDFNGDGKTDIIYGPNLYTGDGTGVLVRGSITLPVALTFGYVAAGDFNRDGRTDLLVSNTNDSSVYTLLGNGAGSFSILSKAVVRSSPGTLTVADFNNDGNADFAVATNTGFSVRLGDGNGNFSGTANLATSAYPYALATADLNKDGYQDLLIANTASSTVAVRLGDGTGNFASNSSVIATNVPYALATGDFNGDTQPDLLVANYGTNTVMFYPGDGAGNLDAGISATAAAGSGPTALGIGDFNNDGRLDMAIGATSGGILVIRLGGTNEINVRSGSSDIPDGSTTTSTSNATDLGTVSYTITRSYTIQNTGQVGLTVSAIRFSGADSSAFTVGGITLPITVPAGSVASFTITFAPTTPGVKTATVNILNNDCDEAVYDFVIKGTATAQQPTLGSYPATTIAAGGNITVAPTAAPANAVQVSVSAPLSF